MLAVSVCAVFAAALTASLVAVGVAGPQLDVQLSAVPQGGSHLVVGGRKVLFYRRGDVVRAFVDKSPVASSVGLDYCASGDIFISMNDDSIFLTTGESVWGPGGAGLTPYATAVFGSPPQLRVAAPLPPVGRVKPTEHPRIDTRGCVNFY